MLATNKYCPRAEQSVEILENNKTLKQILELEQYIDVLEAYEESKFLDQKVKDKQSN